MVELRCPQCHRPVEQIEIGAAPRSRRAWWCDPCRAVVLEEHLVVVPVPRERADLD